MNEDHIIIEAALRVVKAIQEKGSHPEYHDQVMERHRNEWPYLWNELDTLILLLKP